MTTTASNLGSAARSSLARWQFWIILAVIGVAAAVGMQLLDAEDSETYGLENTDLDGYAALASVVQDEGARIHPAYSAQSTSELLEEHPDASVVVVARGFQPSAELVSELEQQNEAGRNVLWLSDDALSLAATLEESVQPGPPITTGAAGTPQTLEATDACSIEPALTAETIQAPGETLFGEAGCFGVEASDEDHGYVLSETNHGLAFTAPDAFTNHRITDEGNAALALGLLGVSPEAEDTHIIWYTPSGADAAEAGQWESPMDYLPSWFWPLAAWLLVCGLLGIFVAGRRYGPVVTEPLPVSVPASESAHGRGRLYQRANAVPMTARTLRSAHLLRLGKLLRLGPSPAAEVVASTAARESGWAEDRVKELLLNAEIRTNKQLTSYAQQLGQLENDVRDRTRMRRRP